MARREFRLPALGEGMTEATIAAWLAAPGARLEAGTPLCEVVTDNSTVTLAAVEGGWLIAIVARVDTAVAPGAVLAVYDTESPDARAGACRAAAPMPGSDRAPSPRADGFVRAYSGAAWESQVGYCRAVRAGPLVVVSGTAPVSPGGGTWAPGDAYAQARRCLEIIETALGELGATMASVVRTRMFVTDIARWAEFGRAHREFFGAHPPATSMVEVHALIAPDMLIEIEADAWCPDAPPAPRGA